MMYRVEITGTVGPIHKALLEFITQFCHGKDPHGLPGIVQLTVNMNDVTVVSDHSQLIDFLKYRMSEPGSHVAEGRVFGVDGKSTRAAEFARMPRSRRVGPITKEDAQGDEYEEGA